MNRLPLETLFLTQVYKQFQKLSNIGYPSSIVPRARWLCDGLQFNQQSAGPRFNPGLELILLLFVITPLSFFFPLPRMQTTH